MEETKARASGAPGFAPAQGRVPPPSPGLSVTAAPHAAADRHRAHQKAAWIFSELELLIESRFQF